MIHEVECELESDKATFLNYIIPFLSFGFRSISVGTGTKV